MTTTLAELLAGLGLLFMGLRLLGQHLQRAAGRRVRRVLQAATRSRWTALAAGTLAGALTQSSNAVTLITANLVQARALSLREALPVVAGANAGTAVLVFLATLDMRLAVLYMVGLAGVSLQFRLDHHPVRRDWLWAGLGLSLLFLGLDLIKHAPDGLDAALWQALLGSGLSAWAALAAGLALALATQSASVASLLAVAALHKGYIGMDAALWIMVGANLGSGAAVLLSAGGLTRSGRRLCLGHMLVKLAGSAIVVLAWLLLVRLAGPAAQWLPQEPAPLLALLFLAMQLAGALPVVMLREHVLALAARLTPPDPAEQSSQPHFIYDQAVQDPLNALQLAVLERERLLAALPELVPDRDVRDADEPARRRALSQGYRSVNEQTMAFLQSLIARGLPRSDLNRALRDQIMLENLRALIETLQEFGAVIDAMPHGQGLAFNLSESLRTLVGLLADTARPDADVHDFDMLVQLTADRGDMMERLRRQLSEAGSHQAWLPQLLLATGLFERAVWLMRRMAVARHPVPADTRPVRGPL